MTHLLDVPTIMTRLQSALSSQLGTYTYPLSDGSDHVTPAIRIVDGTYPIVDGEIWTQEPEVTGLEVVIEPETNTSHQSLLGCDYLVSHDHTITLKQHDITQNVLAARSAVIRELGGWIDQVGARVTRVSALDSIESISFIITLPSTS